MALFKSSVFQPVSATHTEPADWHFAPSFMEKRKKKHRKRPRGNKPMILKLYHDLLETPVLFHQGQDHCNNTHHHVYSSW